MAKKATRPPAAPARQRAAATSVKSSSRGGRGESPSPPLGTSVLIIGSEVAPFAKTGGLADVLGALPVALARLGWDVTVALPRYRGITAGTLVETFPVSLGAFTADVGFYDEPLPEQGSGAPSRGGAARALFVECPPLFDREGIYGIDGADYPDNARRYALLVRATLEFAARRGSGPSVVHAHDWQAGLAPVYLKTLYATHPVIGGTPTVFTIHNLAYQGVFDAHWLPELDLPWDVFTIDRMEYWGKVSLLKGGIVDADIVTTVSRQYAKEIQRPELGFGFDGILRQRSADLVGILNGIDVDEWDPAADPYLPAAYSVDDLRGKAVAKRELLARYGLRATDTLMARPIVGMISRLVDQKGFDLIADAAERLMGLDATWIVLGTGEARYQDLLTALALRNPDRAAVHIGFDEARAHLIEAGADLFLMPSRFEPCGLNQMYSLRYGTVPVVHGVGGLVDTVRDYSPNDPESTGFVFGEYTDVAMVGALERALEVFRHPRRWRALQVAGMRQDNSWHRSAREYVKIYTWALDRSARTTGLKA